jgi:hypothetical protein
MWKQIEDFDYEINSEGVVRRISNKKIKKSHIRKSGYVSVQLCLGITKKSFYLHRLLAMYFIPNVDNKLFVNHINGIKHDNRVCNLEWVSHSENMIHGFKNGLCKVHSKLKDLQKEMSNNRKKKVYYYNVNKELLQVFNSVKEAEQSLGYKGNLSLYCRTNKLTKKGIFSYVPLV